MTVHKYQHCPWWEKKQSQSNCNSVQGTGALSRGFGGEDHKVRLHGLGTHVCCLLDADDGISDHVSVSPGVVVQALCDWEEPIVAQVP